MAHFEARPKGHSDYCVDFLKGFKSSVSSWQPFVCDTAIKSRANFHLLGFESPGASTTFLNEYRQRAFRFFCSEKPILRDATGQPLPRIAGAHSLGVFLLLELMANDETAEILAKNYDAFFLANGFLGNHYHDKWLCRRYSGLPRYKDRAVGHTFLERQFKDVSSHPFSELPTHAQSVMLHDEGTQLLEVLESVSISPALSPHPIMMTSGLYDPVSNNENIERAARAIGARHKTFYAGHNPLLTTTEARFFFWQWSKEQKPFAHLRATAAPKNKDPESLPLLVA